MITPGELLSTTSSGNATSGPFVKVFLSLSSLHLNLCVKLHIFFDYSVVSKIHLKELFWLIWIF